MIPFRDLVELFDRVGATTKRLEMRRLLSIAFAKWPAEVVPPAVFLLLGQLRPDYEGIELGVADSLALRAVAGAFGVPEQAVEQKVRASGDLGTTAEAIASEHPTKPRDRSVLEVYDGLRSIAHESGEGSQDRKIEILTGLLRESTPGEAKYLVRFVLGKLRLGVREMTLLDAFAAAWSDGGKPARERVEAAFNVSSDLGLVGQALARHGLDGLASITLQVGRPVRPMLAERAASLSELLERMEGSSALEYKYDGLRVQAHLAEDGTVRLFSRRLEETSAQFPELRSELPKAIRTRPAIVEGECVPIDPDTDEIRPFQEVSRRRGRKYELERVAEEIPVCLFLFDTLLAGDTPQMDRPMPERRAALAAMLRPTDRIRLAEQRLVHDVDAAQSFFDESIARGCEGIVAKSIDPGSRYHPGGRGFWWIKYKRDYTVGLADSIDAVVVGAFHGRGRRGGRFGALLMAVYNPSEDRYESLCKVGSGFDDATLASLPDRLSGLLSEGRPNGVETGLEPDRWVTPRLVLELRGAELSISPNHRAAVGLVRNDAGLALRFPRFTGRYRTDKGPTEATTSQEILSLYRAQVRQASPERPAAGG